MKNSNAFEMSFQLRPGPRVRDAGLEAQVAGGRGRLPRVTQVLALAVHFDDMIRKVRPRTMPTSRGFRVCAASALVRSCA